ncbi:hypothetical protein, partial [Bradyrhizobium elkanii]|uniref:hypothetical protein n=1 Tax=Bradyrhizobium elkanii TaxID=29448 RepID=UPI001AEBACE1
QAPLGAVIFAITGLTMTAPASQAFAEPSAHYPLLADPRLFSPSAEMPEVSDVTQSYPTSVGKPA